MPPVGANTLRLPGCSIALETEGLFLRLVVVALLPFWCLELSLHQSGLTQALRAVWDWVVAHPLGRWWWLPAALLLPLEDLFANGEQAGGEQKVRWFAPIVLFLFAAVQTYGVFRRDHEADRARVAQRDALQEQSDALRSQFDALRSKVDALESAFEGSVKSESDRILADAGRRAEEAERAACEREQAAIERAAEAERAAIKRAAEAERRTLELLARFLDAEEEP